MDFRYNSYYLIGKDGANADIPKKLKRYFKCKIQCHQYYYNDVYYTHCVSINKKYCYRLVEFLNDCRIDYKPIIKQFEKVRYYQFIYYSDEYLKAKQKVEQVKQEIISKFKAVEQELKKHEECIKQEHLEMLNDMTKATDLDIAEIVIYGYDGYAHRQQFTTSNRCLIEKFRDMCFKCLQTENKL